MRVTKFTGVAAGLTAALLMAGCATGGGQTPAQSPGGSPASGQPQHVTLWLYPIVADEAKHKEHWDQVVSAFEAKNQNITVDYEIFPWANRDEALQTAIAGKVAPDLVYLIPDQLAAYKDAIEPIGPFLSDAHKADLLDNVSASVTMDGQLMGAPILTTANPLLCNAEAFKAAGVTDYPKTWDDVLAMAPKFTEKGMYAIGYSGNPEMTLNLSFYPLLWQAGGHIFGDDGASVAFNDEAGVRALTFITELAKQKALDPDLITTNVPVEQGAIAQGKVGCTWDHAAVDLAPFWGDNIVVLPPLTDKASVSYGTVGSLALLKGAESNEAAGAFAEFASSADQVVPLLKTAGFFSALKSVSGLYADDPVLSAVEASIPTATVGELNTSARAVMGVLTPEIQAALLGQKSPQEALDAAAKAAEPLLKK